ncbi:uncharacterized protein LOC126285260 [Schistocerca gregaria]|uniref:uncharacterized protein LOC126285260 n=1 Tax=Schistocerca gregaria TaxID=7010 RepID=UPI00211E5E72|nr:uncharacterized protein LOC126285260 [Schistocerca gregaria]
MALVEPRSRAAVVGAAHGRGEGAAEGGGRRRARVARRAARGSGLPAAQASLGPEPSASVAPSCPRTPSFPRIPPPSPATAYASGGRSPRCPAASFQALAMTPRA